MTAWVGPLLLLLVTAGVVVLLWMVDQGASHEEVWVPLQNNVAAHGTSTVLVSYVVPETVERRQR